jgi:hypothetical protein
MSDGIESLPCLAGEGDHAQHGGGASAQADALTLRFAPGPSTALRAVPLPRGGRS